MPPAVSSPLGLPAATTPADELVLHDFREFLRVSDIAKARARKRAGSGTSIGQQHRDNLLDAAEEGHSLHPVPYAEIGSASEWRTTIRGNFEQLLTDLREGTFGARGLLLWEDSRASREMEDSVRLFDACKHAGVLVRITSHGATYDPRKPRDRKILLEGAIEAEHEVGRFRLRVLRGNAEAAEEGRPHGKVPLGYERRYDPSTGKIIREYIPETGGRISQWPRDDEAWMIRDLYRWAKAGIDLNKIERKAAEAGMKSRDVIEEDGTVTIGGPLSRQRIRYILLNEAYAGWRLHDRNRPKTNGLARSATAKLYDGQWEGLVSLEDWQAVNRRLRDPGRKTTKGGSAVHTWTAVLTCCDCPTCVVIKGRRLCCDTGHVSIGKDVTNLWLDTVTEEFLARDEVYEWLLAGVDSPELRDVQADLAQARSELTKLRDAAASAMLDIDTLVALEPPLKARVKRLAERERTLAVPDQLSYLLTPGEDVVARWRSAEPSTRRLLVRRLMVPGVMGVPTLMRGVVGRAVPPEERIAWVGAGGDGGVSTIIAT